MFLQFQMCVFVCAYALVYKNSLVRGEETIMFWSPQTQLKIS